MASRINPTRAFHRWQIDVPIDTAIAFDEKCLAAGSRATRRINELIEADLGTATTAKKLKRK